MAVQAEGVVKKAQKRHRSRPNQKMKRRKGKPVPPAVPASPFSHQPMSIPQAAGLGLDVGMAAAAILGAPLRRKDS